MWKNININKQNIKAETTKATLIAMPHNSNYDGYEFWHPSKLIRNGRNSNAISIGYTDDFKFRLVKYGKGKYNSKEIIDEDEISAEDFEEAFGIMNENITKPQQNISLTHKPNKLDAVKDHDAIDELKDE